MQQATQLSESIRDRFTGIWITSHEHADIVRLCHNENRQPATWDVDAGP